VSAWTLGMGLMAAYWLIRIVVVRGRIRSRRFAAEPGDYAHESPTATVSVCIPARNEADVIADCVRDVLAQDYAGLIEVILVDDASDDGTGDLARAAGDERLTVILGDGPPPGWIGKSAALWRAQKEAKGDWLLFVDADVRLHPTALTVAMSAAQHHEAHMVSWFGQLVTRSFWEHVCMPFIGDLIAVFSTLSRVNDEARDDCIANGQFILMERWAYDRIGGHEAVRESVIDDVSLGRAVKFHPPAGHLRHRMLQSRGLMQVRMYDSLGGIWGGFTKNFYAASKQQAGWLIVLVTYLLLTSVLPAVAAVGLTLAGDVTGGIVAGSAVGWMILFRYYTRSYSPAPWWSPWLQPLAALVTAGIVLHSMFIGLGWLKPVRWKGRAVG
jgi:hypothetical protein